MGDLNVGGSAYLIEMVKEVQNVSGGKAFSAAV
jgi:hypothetical protein